MSANSLKRSVLALSLAAACLLPGAVSAAMPSAGDLIKLPDDGNPNTSVDSAVYYYGADGKRYVFPNSQAYFTWYADFNGVKVVSAAEMASISLGGNVVYRPGTRLVKITSDPNVYAVEPGGVLRWIQTEEVALALYGADWNRRIDDIPDAFFFNYTIGDPLAAAIYPSGSVVKRTTDNVLFLIDSRSKRRITSDSVKTGLRLQDKFILTTGSALADYTDGTEIASALASLADTSQKTGTQMPATPTFSVIQPATQYIPTDAEADLLELHISSAKEVNVTQLAVRIDATTGKPATGVTDEDKGGLVYGNNAQANMRLLRWVDAQGNEPFGSKEVLVDITQDQSQTFYFSGAFNVPANSEKVLYFRVQTNSLLPTGEGYKATFLVTGTALRDTSGNTAAFAPTADIAGRTLSTLASALEVKASSDPGSQTYVRGAKNAELAGLTFKATTYAPNVIKAVTFQGYVDEEGVANFLAGGDSDNGSETRVTDMVGQVSLYDGSDAKIAGPVDIDLFGRAAFSGLSLAISAGQSATLILKGDISPTVELENNPNKLTFDVTDASADVTVTDDKGAKVNVIGDLPNGGTKPSFYATIKNHGKAEFSWSGNSGRVLAGSEAQLGTLSIKATEDSYRLKTVSFQQASGLAQSLGYVKLSYPSGSSTVSTDPKLFEGNTLTFSDLNIALDKDKTVDLKLYGQLAGRNAGAVYEEIVKVQFAGAGPVEFSSLTDEQSFFETDISTTASADFRLKSNTVSGIKVGYSKLTVAKTATEPSTVYRDAATDVLNYTITADAAGACRVRKMTFKVSPGEAGKAGAGNDALEKWAAINGDFADDDDVADLDQVAGTTRTLIGEDTMTGLTYTVVHGSTKNTTPVASNYTSAANDYALIEYAFHEGSELFVAAGGTMELQFGIDTSTFYPDKDYSLKVELLGGSDFTWTDITSGTYTPMSGSDSVSNQVTVKK